MGSTDFERQLRRAGLSDQQVRALVYRLDGLIPAIASELRDRGRLPETEDAARARRQVKKRREQISDTADKLDRLLASLVELKGSGFVAIPARYRHSVSRVHQLRHRLKAACAEVEFILNEIRRTVKQPSGRRPDPVLRKLDLNVAMIVQSVGVEPTRTAEGFLLALAHVYSALGLDDRSVEKAARATRKLLIELKSGTKSRGE